MQKTGRKVRKHRIFLEKLQVRQGVKPNLVVEKPVDIVHNEMHIQ